MTSKIKPFKSKLPEPKIGRPEDYKPEFCAMLFDHMKEGYSFETFGAIVGVCRETLYQWAKYNAAFHHAKAKGKLACQLRLENQAKQIAMGDVKGNSAMHIFRMKNMTTWREDAQPEEDEVEDMVFRDE